MPTFHSLLPRSIRSQCPCLINTAAPNRAPDALTPVLEQGGDFFQWFAHTNEDRQGLADNSLIALGLVTYPVALLTVCISNCLVRSFGCCFVRLDLVIEGMLISRFVVQFAAQAVAVLLLRHKNTDPDTFKVPTDCGMHGAYRLWNAGLPDAMVSA